MCFLKVWDDIKIGVCLLISYPQYAILRASANVWYENRLQRYIYSLKTRHLLSIIYPAVNLFYQFRLPMQLFLTTKHMSVFTIPASPRIARCFWVCQRPSLRLSETISEAIRDYLWGGRRLSLMRSETISHYSTGKQSNKQAIFVLPAIRLLFVVEAAYIYSGSNNKRESPTKTAPTDINQSDDSPIRNRKNSRQLSFCPNALCCAKDS